MTTEIKNKIDELLREASRNLDEAVRLADENGESFYWDGPAYGMGGSYRSEEYNKKWDESNHGWMASSQSC